jgi:hypothetical protein
VLDSWYVPSYVVVRQGVSKSSCDTLSGKPPRGRVESTKGSRDSLAKALLVNIYFWTGVLAVTRRLLKRGRMKTGDKRSNRKSSCHSRGGVSTRSFERIATRHHVQAVSVLKTFRLCDRSRQSH